MYVYLLIFLYYLEWQLGTASHTLQLVFSFLFTFRGVSMYAYSLIFLYCLEW